MAHFDLDDKAFYDWAVRKIAKDTKIEEMEEFCTKYPPNELSHIFSVLEQRVIPILHSEGIPITKEQCFKLFRGWFVRMAIATQESTPKDNTQGFDRANLVVKYR
jgi:hypothetical protein